MSSSCVGSDEFFFNTKTTAVTFGEAQTSCLGSGGELARISNLNENSILQDISGNLLASSWIGLQTNIKLNGTDLVSADFVFIDGVAEGLDFLIVEDPWANGEPFEDQVDLDFFCVIYNSAGKWEAINCEEKLPSFFCRTVEAEVCTQSPGIDISGEFIVIVLSVVAIFGVLGLILLTYLVLNKSEEEKLLNNLNIVSLRESNNSIERKPAPLQKTTLNKRYDDATMKTEATIVSSVYSADTTGVGFRKSDKL